MHSFNWQIRGGGYATGQHLGPQRLGFIYCNHRYICHIPKRSRVCCGRYLRESRKHNILPFFKAASRDMRAYMSSKQYRNVPIGVVSYGDYPNPLNAQYLRCGNESEENIDFWLIQASSNYCGSISASIMVANDLQMYTSAFGDNGMPLMLMDWPCIYTAGLRNFTWLSTLYNPTYSQVWAGAIINQFYVNQSRVLGMCKWHLRLPHRAKAYIFQQVW